MLTGVAKDSLATELKLPAIPVSSVPDNSRASTTSDQPLSLPDVSKYRLVQQEAGAGECETMPIAAMEKLYHGRGGLITIPFRTRLEVSYTALERELIESAPLQRLDETRQMSASYSDRGKNLLHTRLEHCKTTLEVADRLGQVCGLNHHERKLLRIAALLHDVGHAPFGHAGEDIINAFSHPTQGVFDHDCRGLEIIQNYPIAGILKKHGVTPAEIVNILRDEDHKDNVPHLHFLVKEIADRVAYLELVYKGTRLAPFKQMWSYSMTDVLGDLIRIVPDPARPGKMLAALAEKAVASNGTVPAPFPTCIGLRDGLFQEYSNHPISCLANAVLMRAIEKQVCSGRLSLKKFPNMTDDAVISTFEPEEQFWLRRGVDKCFEPLAAWSYDAFTPVGLKYVQSHIKPAIEGFLRDGARVVLGDDSHFVCTTPNYAKKVQVPVLINGRIVTREVGTELSNARQFIFVAAVNDVPASKRQIASSMVKRFMQDLTIKEHDLERKVLKPDARSVEDRIFRDLDPDLY